MLSEAVGAGRKGLLSQSLALGRCFTSPFFPVHISQTLGYPCYKVISYHLDLALRELAG